ncbi:MAG: methylated-DNA--[protein]-cysteine S-methyltransferase [Acidimicrobiales bacterium]
MNNHYSKWDQKLASDDEWWPVGTPVGRMVLSGNDEALHLLLLPGEAKMSAFLEGDRPKGRPSAVAKAEAQLQAYFAGQLTRFDVPLDPRGTPWQKAVWGALAEIPFAETRSYGEIARQVGNPRAGRAVGMANNRNPIAVIIPCHRVIGSDGTLTGYGGGLDLKGRLLAHEREVLARLGSPAGQSAPAPMRPQGRRSDVSLA